MILLLIFANLFAQTAPNTIVQSQSSSTLNYKLFLNKNKNYKDYISENAKLESSQSMDNQLTQAQFHFLKGSLKSAERIFNKISELSLDKNWSRLARKKIIYATMRSAQLSKHIEVQNNLIKKAYFFDPSLTPDKTLFPPPLMEKWHQTVKSFPRKIFSLPQWAKHYDVVLVNGQKKYPQSGFIKITPGLKRFHFYSNRFQPLLLKLTPSHLSKHKMNPQPFAQGDCNNPQYNETKWVVFFAPNCLKKATPLETMKTHLPLTPKSSAPATKKPWYLSKTFLWTSALVLGGLAYWHQSHNNKNNSNSPNAIRPNQQTFSNVEKSSQ